MTYTQNLEYKINKQDRNEVIDPREQSDGFYMVGVRGWRKRGIGLRGTNCPWLGGSGSVVPYTKRFDTQSGHIPRLQA